MVKFIFSSKLDGFTPYDYRVFQYQKDGEYYLFWTKKDILIGTFQKVNGAWVQMGGRQMPEEFPKHLGRYIESNQLWI